MHQIQKKIIQKLIYSLELKYSDLKGPTLASDRFWFHLKHLITQGYIEKQSDKYILTMHGRLKAQEFNNITLKDIIKPLTMVVVVLEHKGKYIVTKRLKQPFHGYHSFPGGKVEFGETLSAAATRVIKSELGITVTDFTLKGTQHEMNVNKSGEIIRDVFVYLVKGTAARLPRKTELKEGTLLLTDELTYKKLDPQFKDVDAFFTNLTNPQIFFEEYCTDQEP